MSDNQQAAKESQSAAAKEAQPKEKSAAKQAVPLKTPKGTRVRFVCSSSSSSSCACECEGEGKGMSVERNGTPL